MLRRPAPGDRANLAPMCGRYSITTPVEALRQLFEFEGTPNLGPRYNVAQNQSAPIVRLGDGGAGSGHDGGIVLPKAI